MADAMATCPDFLSTAMMDQVANACVLMASNITTVERVLFMSNPCYASSEEATNGREHNTEREHGSTEGGGKVERQIFALVLLCVVQTLVVRNFERLQGATTA